jgi:hypothetical protein
MSETRTAVAVVGEPRPEPKPVKLDLSELSPARRAYIQELRAQVMVARGIREHCDWLAKTGGLPTTKGGDDEGGKTMGAGTAAIAIGVGTELGFPMNVALTKVTVINNRPAIYGDVALALIRKRGLTDPKKGGGLRWWFDGTPGQDDYTAHVHAKRADTGEELETAFSIGDAKRAGLWGSRTWAKWGALRMLRYRALGFLCRDLFSDVLLGVHLAEELYGEEGGEPTAPPPMTAPPDPQVPHVVDPLWGDGEGVVVDVTPRPAGPVDEQEAPGGAGPVGSGEGPEMPSSPPPDPEAGPDGPVPPSDAPEAPVAPPEGGQEVRQADPAPAGPPAPPSRSPANVERSTLNAKGDVDWMGRPVLERDAQGRVTVVGPAPKQQSPTSTVTKVTKPAPSPVTKPEPKPVPAPAPAPAPAPLKPTPDDDEDVAKVKAAIAAAKARMTAKPAPPAPKGQGTATKPPALFEE